MSTIDDPILGVRDRTSPREREVMGMIRRMEIRISDGAFWQVAGHLLMDNKTKETKQAEPFSGGGFYSRPAPGANAEALVAHVGGSQNPVIVATRDEGLRRAIEQARGSKFDQDETAMFNTAVVACCTKTGKFVASAPGGTAKSLATTDELNDLRAFVMQQFSGTPGHTHALVSGGTITTTTVPVVLPVVAPSTDYPGTQVLEGQ